MTKKIFNSDCQIQISQQQALISTLNRPTYRFIGMDQYTQLTLTNRREANKVYWTEILARAHMAAVTATLRSNQWVNAIDLAAKNSNALAFAANLRGLIESAADTATSQNLVCRVLAEHHSGIENCIAAKHGEGFYISEELENELIHFLYARKLEKGDDSPKSHRAKSVRAYLTVLEAAQIDGVADTYSTLCDMTHPGMLSIRIWLKEESNGECRIQGGQEDKIIEGLARRYPNLLRELLLLAFNPPILVLSILNYFSLPEFHTPSLRKCRLSEIKAWERMQKSLRGARPQC